MPLRLRQVLAALLLLVGLILSLTWHYWADAPLWLLLVGSALTIAGVVLAVTAMAEGWEEIEDDIVSGSDNDANGRMDSADPPT